MSLFLETKRASYNAQRSAAQGATVVLVATANGFNATFGCAKLVASVIGDALLTDLGDGIYESIPQIHIPMDRMQVVCQELTARYSVALVDSCCGDASSRFVCLWKIERRLAEEQPMKFEDL